MRLRDCGLTVFQHACKMGLDGIVSKAPGSRCRSGRTSDWAQVQEPGGTGGDAGGRRGLGHEAVALMVPAGVPEAPDAVRSGWPVGGRFDSARSALDAMSWDLLDQ